MAVTDINLTFSGTPDQYLDGTGTPTNFPSPIDPPAPEQPNQFFVITGTQSPLNPYTYYNGDDNDGVGATITFNAVGLIKEQSFVAGKIGGYTVEVGDSIIYKNAINPIHNGIYDVEINSLTEQCVLRRTVTYDTTSEITTSQVSIQFGNLAGSLFVQQTVDPIIGVDPIVFLNQPRTNVNPFLTIMCDSLIEESLVDYTYLNGPNSSRPGVGARIRMNNVGIFPTINGVEPFVGMRVLLVGMDNPAYNGDAILTTLGNPSQKAVLTRGFSASYSTMKSGFAEFLINNPISLSFGMRFTLDSLVIIPDSQIGIVPLIYIQNNPTISIDSTPTSGSTNAVSSGGTFTALAGKENSISTGTTSQYYRGDKTWQTLNKSVVGLGNVDNTSDINKPISSATQTALDGKQATLVSGTNIKTVGGVSLLGIGDIPVESSGKFGISDSNGVYTYYATMTLAMAAASSGQTIEMFADVVENGSVEITLKDGVNINGNGHTYTLNNSGNIHAFKVITSVNCSVLNLNITRSGSTGTILNNAGLYCSSSASGYINMAGSIVRNIGSGCGICTQSVVLEISYVTAYAKTIYGAIGIFTSAGFKLSNSVGYGTSGGFGIRCHNGGDVTNCIGYSDSGTGFFGDAGTHFQCTGISVSGTGFSAGSAVSAVNCIGRSTSGIGMEATNGLRVYNCVGISVSNTGLTSNGNTYNCSGFSSSGRGVSLHNGAITYNITSRSSSNYSLWAAAINTKIFGGNVICEWNNVGGYGIRGNGGFICSHIHNCRIQLANTSAPYLFNDGIAQAISMRQNEYSGGAAFNVNLTQAITATPDTQGNIFL